MPSSNFAPVSVESPWVTGRRASQSRLDFPAFKVGRGLLVLVLVEEKSTARQQNFFRSPMPLPNFRDCRCRPGGAGACRGEIKGAPAKRFSFFQSPLPLSNFRACRCRPGAGACRREIKGAPAKTFFAFSVPDASVKILLFCAQSLLSPVPSSNFCSCARSLLALVLVEENSTAPRQNLFGPRCLQNHSLFSCVRTTVKISANQKNINF